MPSRIVQSHTEASGDLVAYEFGIDLIPTTHGVEGASLRPAGLVVSNDLIVGFGVLYVTSVIITNTNLDCVLPLDLQPLADGQQLLSCWDDSASEAGFSMVSFGMGENGLPYVSFSFPDPAVRYPDVDDSFDLTGIVRLRA